MVLAIERFVEAARPSFVPPSPSGGLPNTIVAVGRSASYCFESTASVVFEPFQVVPERPGGLKTIIFVDPAPPGNLQTTISVDPKLPGSLETISFVAPT